MTLGEQKLWSEQKQKKFQNPKHYRALSSLQALGSLLSFLKSYVWLEKLKHILNLDLHFCLHVTCLIELEIKKMSNWGHTRHLTLYFCLFVPNFFHDHICKSSPGWCIFWHESFKCLFIFFINLLQSKQQPKQLKNIESSLVAFSVQSHMKNLRMRFKPKKYSISVNMHLSSLKMHPLSLDTLLNSPKRIQFPSSLH